MRAMVVSVLAALAGCDDVFGLDRRTEPCPDTYAPIGTSEHSYRFVEAPKDWLGAHDDCRADTASGVAHLVVFETTAEIAAIQQAFTLAPPLVTHTGFARSLDGDADTFYSLTGDVLTRGDMRWHTGEPNNGLAPEPIVIIREAERLSDAPATFEGHYVCECDGIETPLTFVPPVR